MLSSHPRQSSFVNYNTRVGVKVQHHARIARRPAPKPQSVVSLPIASLLMFEEGPEISTHFLISFFGLKGREWDPCEKETVGSSERCTASQNFPKSDLGLLTPLKLRSDDQQDWA
jgi:hypothetical protein